MSKLPVREMVLYKHGVGFFRREGALSAEEVTLTFRADEINDVLKSLAAFDREGGQVLGIHYQTPLDKAARLSDSSVRLSDTASLFDLLRDLRGREVTLTVEAGSIRGRLLGLDVAKGEEEKLGDSLISIASEHDTIEVYRVKSVRGVQIHDDRAEHDLHFFLDTSMSEDLRRIVTVRLSPGRHWLVVSYVAPSPTWRVSYRVMAEREDGGQSGRALVQGWGLFDNRLDEDLKDVKVTLVAGQPISFVYDLYDSHIPPRPTISEEHRQLSGPVEYRGGGGSSLLKRLDAGGALPERGMAPPAQPAAARAPAPRSQAVYSAAAGPSVKELKEMVQRRLLDEMGSGQAFDLGLEDNLPARLEELFNEILAEENMIFSRNEKQRLRDQILGEILHEPSLDEMRGTVATAAEGSEAGEFFQYVVTTPVSVKRGDSALVPILGTDIQYHKELLYNGAKVPNHPVAALRFLNSTGLTLERGPVTIVEDNKYKGEAIVPFTKPDQEIYLPYAVELGVRVVERPRSRMEMAGLDIQDGYLIVQEYEIQTVTYTIDNTTGQEKSITIEAPIRTEYDLFDTPDPDVSTADHRRWRVTVPAHRMTTFKSKERRMLSRRESVRVLTYRQLQNFFENRWLDQETLGALTTMLDRLALIERLRNEQKQLKEEEQQIYQRQGQLRENLNTLKATGDEGQLRNRMLKQLETSENRLEEISARHAEIELQIAETEAGIDEIIASLGSERSPEA